jgi:transcriptional regulator with XRE-family HTH domain
MTEAWKERLITLINNSGIPPKTLSRKAGLSDTFVRDFLQRDQIPNVVNLGKLCRALDVDIASLFDDSDTRDMLSKHPKARSNPENGQNIAEIDIRAGAGGGGIALLTNVESDGNGNTSVADDVRDLWGIPNRFLREELRASAVAVRIIEVMGDSMNPTLKPGDRVFVDTNHKAPSPPGVYAVWDGFGVVVKRVELIPRTDPPRVLLISDNSSHRQYELTLEEAHIVGRVIGKISLM